MRFKRFFQFSLISIFLFITVSCSNLSYSKLPYFANFGEPGEVLITGKASYLIPGTPGINRVTLVLNKDNEMYGLLEGTYTKHLLKKAVSSNTVVINGRDDFDFIYYGFGKTFFSTVNAEEMVEKRVKNTQAVLTVDIAQKMKKSDVSIYADSPLLYFEDLGVSSEKMQLFFACVTNNIFDLNITMSTEEDAVSFYKLIKNHYFAFKTKQGVSQAEIIGRMDATFNLTDNTVSINSLEDADYIEFWKSEFMKTGSNTENAEKTISNKSEN